MPYADLETSSHDYARRFSGPAGDWLLSVQTQMVRSLLPGRGSFSVLDVGGGHGQLVSPLSEEGHRVFVVGSDTRAFEELDKRESAGTAVADLCRLPFADGSFELVTSIRLLTHTERWSDLVSEMCRVSRNLVLIDYPPLASFNIMYPLLFTLKKKLEGNTRPFTLFRHSEIDRSFFQCGFRLARRSGQFFLPMVVHRRVRSPRISRMAESMFGAVGLSRIFGSPAMALYRKCR